MSYSGILIVAVLWLVIFISLFVSVGHKLAWLDYLYVLSYVKLAVTILKYFPQVQIIKRFMFLVIDDNKF